MGALVIGCAPRSAAGVGSVMAPRASAPTPNVIACFMLPPPFPSVEMAIYWRGVVRLVHKNDTHWRTHPRLTKKSPGMSRGFPRVRLALRSIRGAAAEQVEAVVEPRRDLVRIKAGIRNEPVNSRRQHQSSEPEVLVVELGETVFHAEAPIVVEGVLGTAADGPPGQGLVDLEDGETDQCRGHLKLPKRHAAGGVDHPAVPGIAKAAADRRLPVVLDLECVARKEERGQVRLHDEVSFQISAVEIALDTEHPVASLPLASDLAAADKGAVVAVSIVVEQHHCTAGKHHRYRCDVDVEIVVCR